jgi:hypothetical protein
VAHLRKTSKPAKICAPGRWGRRKTPPQEMIPLPVPH